jgi:hypothetical protein
LRAGLFPGAALRLPQANFRGPFGAVESSFMSDRRLALKLFPHVLIRVGGGSFDRFETLNTSKVVQFANDIHVREERIRQLKNKICDALHELISSINDAKVQNALLNLKRDLFNERNIVAQRIDAIAAHLPTAIHDELRNYLRVKNEIQRLWNEGETVFANEVAAARERLRSLAADDNLRKGLLLSSRSLLRRIESYRTKDSQELRKTDFQTERSLIKYLSRIYAKTSPFSTFTTLAMGRPTAPAKEKSAASLLAPTAWETPDVTSHIRLNNELYAYLKGLLMKSPDVSRWLLVRPNPTLKRDGSHYVFLINSHNIESFQRLPAQPALDLFLELARAKREGIRYQELVQTIIDNEYVDASVAEIEAYINQLIEYGFLEFNIGVSGIDPDWDLKLGAKLGPMAEPLPMIRELLATLEQVRRLSRQYEKATVEDRHRILEAAYSQFKAICLKLHAAAGLPEEERSAAPEPKRSRTEQDDAAAERKDNVFKHHTTTYFYFKPELMFYEDARVSMAPELDEKTLFDLVSVLDQLLQEMRAFERHLDERDQMFYYFVEKYGKTASVDVITFYEDYYREFKKPDQESNPNPMMIPRMMERHERNKAWLNRLAKTIKEQMTERAEEIRLSYEQIKRTDQARLANGDRSENGCSYGAFIQLFSERNESGEEKWMAVLKASFPGHGKMISRFLHVFDESITEDLRQWNQPRHGEDLFVEDCDASFFNANIHPPLMPWEIRTPNGQNSLPEEKQIPVTELQVRVDEKNDRLQLIHQPSQKPIHVFDLGFQGHRGRSPLFHLLANFTPAEYLFCQPVINVINHCYRQRAEQKEDHTERRPRIWTVPRTVYENRIILQRKTWFVPHERLPYRTSSESRWSYFCRLNEWRREQELPEEVFVYVTTPQEMEMLKPEALDRIGRDDYKPQYISFKNPFLVNLFEKLIARVPSVLRIEEMLPSSQQLLTLGQRRYVTEFVIQWYTKS